MLFDLVTLTLKFYLLLKNFNIGHNLNTIKGGAFIFHMCIPYDKTFHMYHAFDLVTLTLKFDLILKNFNIGHNLNTIRGGGSYFTCVFLMTIPFTWNHSFYVPGSNDRGHIVFVLSVYLFVCLFIVNFNLRYNFWTVRDRYFIFGMHTPLMMPLWPWLWLLS